MEQKLKANEDFIDFAGKMKEDVFVDGTGLMELRRF